MTKRKRLGRPTKISAKVRARLVEASKLGLTRGLQAEYAGISVSTLQHWLARGRKATSGQYRQLVAALRASEAEGAFEAMERIRDGQKKDWRAAAWYLERRHGYRRGGPSEARREQAVDELADEDEVQRLRRQLGDVEQANRQALSSGSFQAYFAGQRLARQLAGDLAHLVGSGDDVALEDMGSDAFARDFEAAAREWPDQLLEVAISVYESRHNIRMMKVVEGGRA